MNLVERVKNVLLQPKAEWEAISAENTTTAELYQSYIAPLAAIGPIASIIGFSLVGVNIPFVGTYRLSFFGALSHALSTYILALVGVFVVALVIDALAPTFGGEKNQIQALKVATYTSTPGWVAGAAMILPMLGVVGLLAGLYGIYLFYLGLPVLMKVPQDKAVGYTAATVVVAIVVMVIISSVSSVFMPGMPGMPGPGFGVH